MYRVRVSIILAPTLAALVPKHQVDARNVRSLSTHSLESILALHCPNNVCKILSKLFLFSKYTKLEAKPKLGALTVLFSNW